MINFSKNLARCTWPEAYKHCAECEFHSQCYKTMIEKDDLSLLPMLSGKERTKLHKKGIFTVTQLSYTFRPRKKPKHAFSKPTKNYHSLKALAIRENKTIIAGRPSLEIEGTPLYFDVEGIPDQDFYYLIGYRFKKNGHFIQKSLWANRFASEKNIWDEFLENLSCIENPKLIHYGSYETRFLKRMKERYGEGAVNPSFLDSVITTSLNLLSIIYAQIYFPTYSNSLKDIAQHLGFKWSNKNASGLNVLLWRYQWEQTQSISLKQRILTYNAEDCQALQKVTDNVIYLSRVCEHRNGIAQNQVMLADSLKPKNQGCLGRNKFVVPELEYINQCAFWGYQRDRVYIKSNKRLKRVSMKIIKNVAKSPPVNKIIETYPPSRCPNCGSTKIRKACRVNRVLYDIKFSRHGVKRWIVKYIFNRYLCLRCKKSFTPEDRCKTKSKYGFDLKAYVIYQIIELRIPQFAIVKSMNQLFNLNMDKTGSSINRIKSSVAQFHIETYEKILKRIINGRLIHADETKATVKGKRAYVWILTNLEEVVYIYSETRQGDMVQSLLKEFKGVLISDFYSAYDSINCPQQKCLIHLLRDLNNAVLKHPFNEELRLLVREFAGLLKPMINTVDRFGLKTHFLKKHKKFVGRFYKQLEKKHYTDETNIKLKKRLAKNRSKLFTFLDYDGVPWNNNNAEHAVKGFARLRTVIGGMSTEKGTRDYLTLLSIAETCKCKGINFLQFLRSGQKDVDEFINV
ncbi:IS66 family transposase [Planctomycetota bacterium]